jgi:tetratricopeptide (TPR) repeat protein
MTWTGPARRDGAADGAEAVARPRARRLLLPWLLALLASACAAAPPSLTTPAQRLSALLLDVRSAGLAVDDPRALDPTVTGLAERALGRRGSIPERLRQLSSWLTAHRAGGPGFRYVETETLTARQAWQARAGNCLSFAHLFNALADALGIPMDYVRYRAPSAYEERHGQLVVVSHVASLYDRDRETVLVDLSGQEMSPLRSDYERLTIDEVMALHISNLAMTRLGAGELALPERLLRALVARAPHLPDLHNNLGAVLLRAGRFTEALELLQRALERFPSFVPLYLNASLAARGAGQAQLAEELSAKAAAPWTDPFVPFVRAAHLLERGQAVLAVAILRRVVRMAPQSATFHLYLARGLFAIGQRHEAHRMVAQAHQLDPRHPLLVSISRELGLRPAGER